MFKKFQKRVEFLKKMVIEDKELFKMKSLSKKSETAAQQADINSIVGKLQSFGLTDEHKLCNELRFIKELSDKS